MGYWDPPEPREISERRLIEREEDCRAEGCLDCEGDYLPGFLDPDPKGNGWTLVCSACGATHDVWEAQRDAENDWEPD